MSVFYSTAASRRLERVLGYYPGHSQVPPPPENVLFNVQQQVISSDTGGTDDFTAAGFGTPKGALANIIHTTAAGTIAGDAGGVLSFTDFTNQFFTAWYTEHALATSDTARLMNSSNFAETINATGTFSQASADASAITDGMRLTWATSGAPVDYLMNSLMFGGSAVTVASGFTGGISWNAGVPQEITCGFTPDVVLLACNGVAGSSIISTDANLSFGWAVQGTQGGCIGYRDRSGLATTVVQGSISNLRVAVMLEGANPKRDLRLWSVSSTGFSLYPVLGTWVYPLGWMAIKLAATADVASGVFDAPTTAGPFGIHVGFKPRLVLQLLSNLSTPDQWIGNDALFGLSMITDSAQISGSTTSQNNAADSAARATMNTKAVYHSGHGGSLLWVGDFLGFTSSGYQINYTTVPGTAAKGLWLAFR